MSVVTVHHVREVKRHPHRVSHQGGLPIKTTLQPEAKDGRRGGNTKSDKMALKE